MANGSSCLTRAIDLRDTAAAGLHEFDSCSLSAARPPASKSPVHRGRRSLAACFRRRKAWQDRQCHANAAHGPECLKIPDSRQASEPRYGPPKRVKVRDFGQASAPRPALHANSLGSLYDCSPKGDGHFLHGDCDHSTSPIGDGHGKSMCPPIVDIVSSFRVFHLNINGFDSHAHLLDALLTLHDFPEFVALTETHLIPNVVKDIELSKYKLVSRRDRPDARGWGGVALFARADVHANVVLINESDSIEAVWHTLHCDVGPVLLGVWYRRPNPGEIASIEAFDRELEGHTGHVATVVVGDMNVHHEDWLKFSNGSSREGKLLEQISASHGLKQRVKKPTRGNHLLDLVLTDLHGDVVCDVVPGVLDNDHSATIASVKVTIPCASAPTRECFNIAKARWADLLQAFANEDWRSLIGNCDADTTADTLREHILTTAERYIPKKMVKERPYQHPWVDRKCQDLLRKKHAAIGTPEFAAARDACTAGFVEAHANFAAKTRRTLQSASPKDWWNTSKQLLGQSRAKESIPPLQSADGWAKDPVDKATLLSQTFAAKSKLSPAETNEFTPVIASSSSLDRFLRLRVRAVKKILKDLDESSGTGPDALPSIILRRCASALALPITLLARKCLNEGRWPNCWRQHWVHPLHKRKSKADPRNYRGVHLTAQISKVVERAIGSVFVPWMYENSFGPHQYAYAAHKSHRDVLAINVCSWLLLFEEGHAIGLYCSDVSGAFDRVDRDRMCAKIRASGLPDQVVKFLESWLEDRISNVVVSGFKSVDEVLANSVFQGTVLGSALWNLFYADANRAVRGLGFVETVFADDFNCWKSLPKDVKELEAVLELSACQASLHNWGGANRVIFDSSKESFVLMRRFRAIGVNFKLLGVTFDPQLLMHVGTRKIAIEAGWRLQAVLRPRRFFTTPELFRLYKSLVVSFIESGTPGYFHAAESVLDCIDRVQRRFLREMDMPEEAALINFRLAPLRARRGMAILGFLHRVNLDQVSDQIKAMFPQIGQRPDIGDHISARVRGATAWHNRQLLDRVTATSTGQFKRSIYGMVQCYNALPQHIVNHKSVKAFQRALQLGLTRRAKQGYEGWQMIFTEGRQYSSLLQFQAFFD